MTTLRSAIVGGGVFFLVLVGGGGCGGGGAGGSCGKVQPCGGDLTGTWTIVSSCVDKAALMMGIEEAVGTFCPTATVTGAKLTTSGSLSFSAGLTYTETTETTGSLDVHVPATCLAGATCATASLLFQLQVIQNPQGGIQSFACTGTTSCDCTVVPTPVTVNDSGVYSLRGSVVSKTSAVGSANDQQYCVDGSTVHFMTIDRTMSPGAAATTTITSDVVATKS